MKTPQPFRPCPPASHRVRRVAALVMSALLLMVGSAPAQSAKGKPLKLKINSPAKSIHVGDSITLEIVCLDHENEAAPAPREYAVNLIIHPPSGKVDSSVVTIAAGESSGKISLVVHEAGLLRLQAQHARLQEGGRFMRVRPTHAKPRSSELPQAERVSVSSETARTPAQVPSPAPVESMRLTARESAAPLVAGKPTITLRYSPQRTLLADGKDGATIQAFLLEESDSLAQDLSINFFNSSGSLQQPLVIPAGENFGTALLTSVDVQTVTVEYLRSKPAAVVEGEKKLQIKFGPAITQIVLDPSPARITLVDECDLNVKLLDGQGRTTETDVPRTISFEIDQGHGEIENKEITLAPGSFTGRTTFRPTWRGEVVLASATPNLPTSNAAITVTLPTMLLLLTVAGGIAGGFIAYWREPNAKWWRVLIGLLTGFVLYWGFVFNLLPLVPRNVALNPLSALAFAVIGGWLGTEVFNIILKKFGIGGGTSARGKREK